MGTGRTDEFRKDAVRISGPRVAASASDPQVLARQIIWQASCSAYGPGWT